MKGLFGLVLLFVWISTNAQISEPIAMNLESPAYHISDSSKILLSNSEPPNISFIVSSNLKENTLNIKTNFKGEYKVRFIDYYARSRKVYKNVFSDFTINLEEFEKSIFIMNIVDKQSNKLLTSQVLNLKRRHL